ncbi:MAG: hypothetical protein ACOVOV_17970, partial [Dolichospermum sp.]
MLKKLLLFSTFLWFSSITLFAQLTPVTINNGFNKDLIVNGSGTAGTSVTSAFDASNFAFVAQDYPGVSTCFLPNSGILNSALTAGLSYKLASYSANNCFHVTATTGSSVLSFATPIAAKDVYVLWSSGQGTCVVDVTVTFSDLTTQIFPSITVADWFGGTAAVTNIGRCNIASGVVDPCAANGPNFYEAKLALLANNQTKNIVSVTVSKTSGAGFLGVFAVSVLSNGPVLPPIAGFFPSMATPNYSPGMDTVWLNSPQKLVSTSTNSARSYWDLPDETFLEPGYSRSNVAGSAYSYIDTAKYSQSFTYTFKRRGFWPVRLLSVGFTQPSVNRDEILRYIFVDTPGTVPVSNF